MNVTITDLREIVEPCTKNGSDIPVGTYFMGRICHKEDVLFLKNFAGIVDLRNPRNTWESSWTGYVTDYKPVRVEIIIKEDIL